MKKVLVAGANSYVGNAFKRWIDESHADAIQVDTVGVRNGEWKERSCEGYDAILHASGIAHVSTAKSMESLYYKVNTELPGEGGTVHPQNENYVCTSDLVSMIGRVHGHRVHRVGICNGLIRKLVDKNVTINKLFGDFVYAQELSVYPHDYKDRDFFNSIILTEKSEYSTI